MSLVIAVLCAYRGEVAFPDFGMWRPETERLEIVLENCAFVGAIFILLWLLTRSAPRVAAALHSAAVALSLSILFGIVIRTSLHPPGPLLVLLPIALYPLVSLAPGRHLGARVLVLGYATLATAYEVVAYRAWRYGVSAGGWFEVPYWGTALLGLPLLALWAHSRSRPDPQEPVLHMELETAPGERRITMR